MTLSTSHKLKSILKKQRWWKPMLIKKWSRTHFEFSSTISYWVVFTNKLLIINYINFKMAHNLDYVIRKIWFWLVDINDKNPCLLLRFQGLSINYWGPLLCFDWRWNAYDHFLSFNFTSKNQRKKNYFSYCLLNKQ